MQLTAPSCKTGAREDDHNSQPDPTPIQEKMLEKENVIEKGSSTTAFFMDESWMQKAQRTKGCNDSLFNLFFSSDTM